MVDRSRRDPQKIGEVISDLLASRGYGQLAAEQACAKAWNTVVGELGAFSRATEIRRGVLHVVVSNSVVMQELTFRKQELLRDVSTALPEADIRELRFRVGRID